LALFCRGPVFRSPFLRVLLWAFFLVRRFLCVAFFCASCGISCSSSSSPLFGGKRPAGGEAGCGAVLGGRFWRARHQQLILY
jgi:hypothetical protein